ncbi:MAG: sugar phosphate isomerase/epimerase [Candidatus Latescibacterota bacterium]
MNVSLFSQSLFSLDLSQAIATTAQIGFPAIELACIKPHFDLTTAQKEPGCIADRIEEAGLAVSALSLFSSFTDPSCLEEQIVAAETYIRLAPLVRTKLLKVTPGAPGSAQATEAHWQSLSKALDRLIPVSEEVGVQLAFETHMRQLTDTLASSQRLMEMVSAGSTGLTVDFLNMAFAGESMPEVIRVLGDRMLHTHVKNGTIDANGGWHFEALDTGLIDYAVLLKSVRDAGYTGYLSIECLGGKAAQMPAQTARRDLKILNDCLA